MLRRIAVPFVVLSIGRIISVIMCSGVNAASSQIVRCAVYPRSWCSLHGSAIIWLLFVSWIRVRVLRVTLWLSSGLLVMKFRILSNIIMLWRSDGLMMSVVVFGFVYA